MSDVHTPEVRSFNMSRIKGKDTKPEIIVRKFLHSQGFRFRLHKKKLPGKPDIVLKKYNTIIFVHGCFWHGHNNCKYFVIPKTRTKWWITKIEKTKKVDRGNNIRLRKMRWKIITIWECGLRPKKIEKTLNNLFNKLNEE